MHSLRLCTLAEKRLLCAVTAAPSLRGWGVSHHLVQAADSLPGPASHSLVTSRRVPSLAAVAVRPQSVDATHVPGGVMWLASHKAPLTSFGRLPEFLRFVIMVLRGVVAVVCTGRIALGQDDHSRGIANGRVGGRWALIRLPFACLQTTDKRCGLDGQEPIFPLSILPRPRPGLPPPPHEEKKKEREGETIKKRRREKEK